jgi:hypothetical protein
MHQLRGLAVTLAVLSLAVPGVAAAGSSPNDALVFRSASGALRVVDPVTGPLRTLPAGVLSKGGKTLLTAQVHGDRTVIRRIETRSGAVLAHRSIAGAWGFQRAAADGTLVAGGEQLEPVALVAASRVNGYHGSARTTRIALLPYSLGGKLRVLTLRGDFGVDALAPDGTTLYLIQHLAGAHYRVRGYQLDRFVKHKLSGPIVDKREPDEKMQGLPLARASSAFGSMELTLYQRPSGAPFVHALMTTGKYAFCIDLPAAARVDPSKPSSWGVSTRGTDMYVANATTGWVGVIDLVHFTVARSASLGAEASTMSSPRPLAVSADGSTLYLARPSGVVPIASASLDAGKLLAQRAFGSLALGTDGSMLYASGGGTTLALDTHTGAASKTFRTSGGLTLVGIAKGPSR